MSRFGAADLSVVIPTSGRWDRLGTTLAALAAQTEQGFETIVVVDGGEEDVPTLRDARVLVQPRAGPGVARNLGVGASERALALFINDDMVPRPELVAEHLRIHRDEPSLEVAALGRVVWHPNVPRDRLHRWLDWSGALFEYRMLEEQQERDALWSRFYSCNVSLKREFFVASGGFDPDFVFDYEDLDLGWRLGQRGMRLLYARQAVVEHLHPYGWPAVERRYRSRAAAERLMMAKHGWFKPWFHGQMQEALNQPRASSLWARAVDWTPARPARLRRAVERRADRHYRQRLAPVFLEAWSAASSQRSGQQATAAPRPGA